MTGQSQDNLNLGDNAAINGDVFTGGKKVDITVDAISTSGGGEVNVAGGNIIKAEAGATIIFGAQAGAGLQALSELVQTSVEVRAAVASFGVDFQASLNQVDVVGDYKVLHDLLHQTQFHCYEPIVRELSRFPDETTLDLLASYQSNLRDILTNLQNLAEQKRITLSDSIWFHDFDIACQELGKAVQDLSIDLLKKAVWRIKRILTSQPVRINTRLIDSARALQLPELLQALSSLREPLLALKVEEDKINKFQDGLDALEKINTSLEALLDEHDRWQAVDVELRRIESLIEQDLSELEMSWEDIKSQAYPLCTRRGQDWTSSFQEHCHTLEESLGANNPPRARRAFRSFRREASSRFYQVDIDLKNLCGELRQIGEPLAAIVRSLA